MKTTSLMLAVLGLTLQVSLPVAPAQTGPGEMITLPEYAVWCTDISVPRTADDAQYNGMLTAAVSIIDKALGTGASTGTPFVAKSVNRPADPNGTNREEYITVTVCAAVPLGATPPSSNQVYREVRSREVVFAAACLITESAKCIDDLRKALVARLAPTLVKDVESVFWRSVLARTEAKNAEDLRSILTATDVRLVTAAPQVVITGDVATAAALTKPIDKQEPRPLLTARPSHFEVKVQPEDKWVVVAISLTPEMVLALQK